MLDFLKLVSYTFFSFPLDQQAIILTQSPTIFTKIDYGIIDVLLQDFFNLKTFCKKASTISSLREFFNWNLELNN